MPEHRHEMASALVYGLDLLVQLALSGVPRRSNGVSGPGLADNSGRKSTTPDLPDTRLHPKVSQDNTPAERGEATLAQFKSRTAAKQARAQWVRTALRTSKDRYVVSKTTILPYVTL